MRGQVVVILGSESDKHVAAESKLSRVLRGVGVPYEISVISAHRNPEELTRYVTNSSEPDDPVVFICGAGMAAALPGAVAALTTPTWYPTMVIGVALPSAEFQNGLDAMLAITRMPPGVPVAFAGIGRAGFENAAILACQALALGSHEIRDGLVTYFKTNTKQPQLAIECYHSGGEEVSDGAAS